MAKWRIQAEVNPDIIVEAKDRESAIVAFWNKEQKEGVAINITEVTKLDKNGIGIDDDEEEESE